MNGNTFPAITTPSSTTMSSSTSPFEEEVYCSFCNKRRSQVGRLPCDHQMCASCYPYFISRLKKCYLCVVECGSAEKRHMFLVNTYKPMDDRREKHFCSYDSCDFIGDQSEMNEHEEICVFKYLNSDESQWSERSDSVANTTTSPSTGARSVPKIRKRSVAALKKETDSSEARDQITSLCSKIKKMPYWNGVLIAIVAVLILNWNSAQVEPQYLTVRRNGFSDPNVEYHIMYKFTDISNLVVRAWLNKREIQLSEFVDMQGYQVRLGVGASFVSAENVVKLWATATVRKADDDVWSVNEYMQVRVEHSDPNLVQSYDFQPEQRGSWNEYTSHRKKLLYRHMKVESSGRMKLLRFSCNLAYEEGVAKKFINDDTLTLGFKLFKRR